MLAFLRALAVKPLLRLWKSHHLPTPIDVIQPCFSKKIFGIVFYYNKMVQTINSCHRIPGIRRVIAREILAVVILKTQGGIITRDLAE
jgi:hypothetical protein